VKLGAGVVLLDEPTAQLDVRGEAEIFDRLLAATRHCTTILISHPLLHRAPRRSHLRARARAGRRARHATTS
jgi:ABC-type transport system involved in cytochrome bd biosynthesis fused ATPase/permease subunit